jgi:hypothetical protein
MDTVTLDAQTQAMLGARGWVNFMSMITATTMGASGAAGGPHTR